MKNVVLIPKNKIPQNTPALCPSAPFAVIWAKLVTQIKSNQILYCINSLQSQEGGAIMTEKT